MNDVSRTSATLLPADLILPMGLGTALSLLGDSTLYTVLPTHTAAAGVPVAAVGVLLGINRLVRLLSNTAAGHLFDRGNTRLLFILSLLLGALSTLLCGLATGLWPLLLARALWGLAWSGIWVGGANMLLGASPPRERGRWLGTLQIWFFAGTAGGSLLGGLFTDLLGYRGALLAGGGLSLAGALTAALTLPGGGSLPRSGAAPRQERPSRRGARLNHPGLATAALVQGVNRLALSGLLASVISLLTRDRLAPAAALIGVSTLTGILNMGRTGVSMASALTFGRLSDALGSRRLATSTSLAAGVAGLHLLSYASPPAFIAGLALAAVAAGSIPVLARSLAGDFSGHGSRGRAVAAVQTAGDLGSAVGPPLAFLLMPLTGLPLLFNVSAGIFALCLLPVNLVRGFTASGAKGGGGADE